MSEPAAEGGSVEFDFALPEPIDTLSFEAPAGTTDSGAVTPNPAWSTLKDILPREFHGQVDPILSKWDQDVQARFQTNAAKVREEYAKYDAYEPIVQQGIPADQLLASHNIISQMNANPVQFFERFKAVLIQQGLYTEAAKVQDHIEDITDENTLGHDPRFDQLAQQQQQLAAQQQQFFQTVEQQRIAALESETDARIDQQIASDFDSLESQVGKLPEDVRDMVIDQSLLLMNKLGRPVSVREGYQEVVRIRERMLSTPRPGQLAPRVVPTGGGFPAQQADPNAHKTREGRLAAMQQIIERDRSS